eukprot:CAMPEP_0201915626 /NCGR_PEP_ID=MMETSP0903-20130614/5499_1 /ASSEMBLY_ACC=CAM_ASM_000552 /TAXON_ID=420261 /ORGANISM="Thalassiosira antarctica, Strain CCMP982" /LENGTH=39 /DNA_ID= /DNA_START= /DNA_END= /DNA_ORIENTATION=
MESDRDEPSPNSKSSAASESTCEVEPDAPSMAPSEPESL